MGTDSYDTVADAVVPSGEDGDDFGMFNNEENESDNENDNRDRTDKESSFEQMKARMEEQMEETESFMSDPMTDEELYAAMIMREPKLKWNLVKNEI